MSGTSYRGRNQDFNLTNLGAAASRLATVPADQERPTPPPAYEHVAGGAAALEDVSLVIEFQHSPQPSGSESPDDEIRAVAEQSGFEPIPASRRVSALARWFNKKKVNTPEDGITDDNL